jgi:malic enzyme
LGLGAAVSKASKITDSMIVAAAKALSEFTTDEELKQGKPFPDLSKMREISRFIAKHVCEQAVKEKVSRVEKIPENWFEYIDEYIYEPNYYNLE